MGENHVGIYYHPLRILPKEKGIPLMRQAKKWWNFARELADTDEQRRHLDRAEMQCVYYMQIAEYEDKYLNGTPGQKEAYVARNRWLYGMVVKDNIFMNPDIPVPDCPDMTVSPDLWHKLG